MAGNNDPMDVPLIERRRHPIFPPVQALVLYVVVAMLVAAVTWQWTQRADDKVDSAKATAEYERCVAGNEILENGNRQAEVLRTIVRTLRDNRADTTALERDPVKRKLGVEAVAEYERLEKLIIDYPTFECNKDGTRKPR